MYLNGYMKYEALARELVPKSNIFERLSSLVNYLDKLMAD